MGCVVSHYLNGLAFRHVGAIVQCSIMLWLKCYNLDADDKIIISKMTGVPEFFLPLV
jgi:hypothetical protein